MDLESYALTHEQTAVGNSETSGTAAKRDLKGKGREHDDDGISRNDAEEVTLEKDVKQLAQNVSSWWSGFSKRSQEQFASAQKEIASQGGIMSYARKEASKLEAQLGEARKQAIVQKEQEDQGQVKARQAKPREGQEVDEDKEEQDSLSPSTIRSDKLEKESSTSTTPADAAEQNPASLLGRLQTLSTDPRVAALQSEVSQRLSSLFAPLSQQQRQNQEGEAGSGTQRETLVAQQSKAIAQTVQSTLQDVSTSLRQLGGPEGKAYAQRYLKASEELVGKMGEEWKDMMSELVRVVPADGQSQTGQQTAVASEASNTAKLDKGAPATDSGDAAAAPARTPSAAGATATTTPAASSAAASTDDEDAFSWEDGAPDNGSTPVAANASTVPKSQPPSQVAASAVSIQPAADKSKTDAKLQTQKADNTAEIAKKDNARQEDEDDDSDWE